MQILVVEDNPDVVANIFDFLEAAGHELDVAYSGRSGLEMATHNDYDALILDLMLPGMDGLEVCKQLRQQGHDVPVLMLTARDTLPDKLQGFEVGADDYLVKPFALQELEARLLALSKRSQHSVSGERLQVGDLQLDPQCHQVSRDGKQLILPPIPFRILEVLMRLSPQVVSRARLESFVWGDDKPETDALRTHLYTLRGIIDKPFRQQLLHTIPKQGYQLVCRD